MLKNLSLSILTLLLLTTLSVAQVTTTSITGTVLDPSSAPLPDAALKLTNERTGVERRANSSANGAYRFDFLELGSYTLEIEAAGFRTERRTGLVLEQSGRTVLVDIPLQISSQTESVTVSAEIPLLATSTSEQRESRAGDLANQLPVGRRDLNRILDLAAGVRAGQGNGTFIMNGLGSSSLTITQDGTDATSNLETPSTSFSGGFNTLSMTSLEAIEEVQVTKGVLPAEYGRVISGNINVITKSGTNEVHGSGFYLLRRDALNARDPFLPAKAPLNHNQFGGSIGGPVWKNRVFYFAAVEWVRSSLGATVSQTVPTQFLRNAVPSSAPTLRQVLNLFPLPNTGTPGPTDAVGIFIGPGDQNIDDGNQTYKADAWLTSRWKLTTSYNYSSPTQNIPRAEEINPRRFIGRSHRGALQLTRFANSWNSETRFGYNRPNFERSDGLFNAIETSKPEDFFGGRRLPGFRGLGIQLDGELRLFGDAPQFSLDQKVSLLRGRHAIKFGGMYFRQQYSNLNIENPRFTFSNANDFINNTPNAVRFTFGTPKFLATVNQIGLFVQDDWRVNSSLTLNLGMRWDGFGSPYARGEDGGPPHHFNPDGFDAAFRLGPFRPIDRPYEPSLQNFAPRFGFAQQIGKKMVVRGAYGILFAPLTGSISRSNTVFTSPEFPFRVDLTRADAARFGVRYDGIQFNEQAIALVTGPSGTSAFNVIDPNIKAPYSQNFSLQVQRQFAKDLVFETGYVGARGVRFIISQQYNEQDRTTRLRPNPSIGTARYVRNGDSTIFNSWQSTLRKRFSSGLSLEAYYTWGKVLSYGQGDVGSGELDNGQLQGFNELGNNRGPADLDAQHDIKWSALYQLPRLANTNGFVRQVIGGWQVASIYRYRSGVPLTVFQSNSAVSTRPDVVAGVNPILGISPGLLYLDRAAFAPVPVVSGVAIRPGNLGRNALRGPENWNLDFSLGKKFAITERIALDIRADFMNATNRRNYGNPVLDISNNNFGRIASGGPPRDVQLNARFSF